MQTPGVFMNLIKFLESKSKRFLIVISIILVFVIAWIDWHTPKIFLSFFYLFPVCFATWFVGKYVGIFVSLLSSAIWLVEYSRLSKLFDFHYHLVDCWNVFVFLGFYLLTTYLLSKLKYSIKTLEKMAKLDFLTGLTNRMFFMEIAKHELNRTSRYKDNLTLAYIDVDDFKQVNDTYGHAAGDSLLCLIADVAQKNLRKIDVMTRMGGDEFAILLPHTTYEEAKIVLSRIQAILLDSMRQCGFNVTFSIGAITFVHPPQSVHEMLDKADNLMYRAKKAGKNLLKHEVYSATVSTS